MKQNFSAYYRPTNDKLLELWNNCVFVLDTNVLLGLYRYPKEARDDLVGVLRQTSDRLWIPHQVALEYEQDRLSVIADQVNKYTEVSKIIADVKGALIEKLEGLQLRKRHSAINPEPFLQKVEQVFNEFEHELEAHRKNQPDVSDDDRIRDDLDTLLAGKVGKPFTQKELESLYDEGKLRFGQKRPPGYLDKGKTKQDDAYFYQDLDIRREYGDLIIWRQIVKESHARKLTHIIFVTDDEKEDWWWKQSGKTIGPRPELVEEICTGANVSAFYMYTSARFLRYAKEYLGAKVKQESINQVREITQFQRRGASAGPIYSSKFFGEIEKTIYEWLKSVYPNSEIVTTERRFPDFIVTCEDAAKIGVEVKYARDPRLVSVRYQDVIYRGAYEITKGIFDTFNLVIVVEDEEGITFASRIFTSRRIDKPDTVKVVLGKIARDDETGVSVFQPIMTV
jgi:hypothetical protein